MSFFLDLLFPPRCCGCGRLGDYLCPSCQNTLISLPVKPSLEPHLQGTLSLFKYHGCLKDILKELKFNFVTDTADAISFLAVSSLKTNYPHLLEFWQQNSFVFVPIPLHFFRQNWRGFNQASLLGRSIAPKLNLPCVDDLLIRSRHTPPQTSHKDKSFRLKNLSSAFSLNKTLPSPNILLFDDVLTTGATLKNATLCFPPSTNFWFLTLAG